MTEWQPIETARREGRRVLIFVPSDSEEWDNSITYVCRWDGEAWLEAGGEEYSTFDPTHWMPLPDPPK